ncbi:hypothetical protein IVB18_47290 [Bradyrhizobium sp. 186]|uniref:hypothetical protein n=1 Tax=Bradyrhizobium sp. 186 TaxID=2782654 RepID=UPI002001AF55|nr:hypothetical protein [Bradyrhizobium sp. 186]UPK35471.1 hypothetical protein IVB18_47290 [Bradyrhizobium sp. 186]
MNNSTEQLPNALDQLVKRYQTPTSTIVETLEKYRTLDEAATLPNEQYLAFCMRVGLDHASEDFKYQRRLGSRYGRWLAALGNERIGVAFLYLFSVSDFEFDKMLKESTDLMIQLEQAEDYAGPGRHTPVH